MLDLEQEITQATEKQQQLQQQAEAASAQEYEAEIDASVQLLQERLDIIFGSELQGALGLEIVRGPSPYATFSYRDTTFYLYYNAEAQPPFTFSSTQPDSGATLSQGEVRAHILVAMGKVRQAEPEETPAPIETE